MKNIFFNCGGKYLKAATVAAIFMMPLLLQAARTRASNQDVINISFLLMIFALSVFIKLGVLAFVLVYSVLRPQTILNGSRRLAKGFIKPFIIGVLFAIAYALLGKICSTLPVTIKHLVALALLVVFSLHFLIGGTVVCHLLGERIQANTNSRSRGSTFIAVLYGGIAILLLDMVPVMGQITSILIILLALGAAQGSLRKSRNPIV
jgi:hypothetical protein